MIVPDINLLLYAHVSAYPRHADARTWWEATLSGEHDIGLALPVVFGFVRIATNAQVFVKPMTTDQAIARVESWLQVPLVRILQPGPRHLDIAFALLRELGTARGLTTDAQIAALAIEHQAELHSNDSDFARFPGVRWIDPLR